MLDNAILTGQVGLDLRLSFITTKDQVLFTQLFKSAVGKETTLSGDTARDMLWQSGLDASTLSCIWLVFASLVYDIHANIVGCLPTPQNLGNFTFLSSH